jgi:hypothetical protein
MAADWNALAKALRELHRALMESARRDYEREHFTALDPASLLRLLTTAPEFEWLRGLSELMADIDVVRDADPQTMDELEAAVRGSVEHFVTAPASAAEATPFSERYFPYLQHDPHVAMAHAGVKKALGSLPRPQKSDAAGLLHERHQLAEKARHRKSRP